MDGTVAEPPTGETADSTWRHVGRYLGASFAVGLAMVVLVGLFWQARILARTGYRRRDLLLLLVPLVNVIVPTRSLWRYTARDVYWSARSDRPSSVQPTGQRRPVIWGGWRVYTAVLTLSVLAGALVPGSEGWTGPNRDALRDALESEGVPRDVAACVVASIVAELPEGPPTDEDDPRLAPAFDKAFAECS